MSSFKVIIVLFETSENSLLVLYSTVGNNSLIALTILDLSVVFSVDKSPTLVSLSLTLYLRQQFVSWYLMQFYLHKLFLPYLTSYPNSLIVRVKFIYFNISQIVS